jgi:nitrile hydratase
MEGVHDMGGLQGYGGMPAERDNHPFHAPWESIGYVCSSIAVIDGSFSADAIRYAIERIPARDYITMSYFERVITGIASLYVERGLISREELEQRSGGHFPLSRCGDERVPARPAAESYQRGDSVMVRCSPTSGHSRAPRYVWDKCGVVVGVAPPTDFAGEAAAGDPTAVHREPTYHVRFEARALWPEVRDGSTVVVDLFQSYLVRAPASR